MAVPAVEHTVVGPSTNSATSYTISPITVETDEQLVVLLNLREEGSTPENAGTGNVTWTPGAGDAVTTTHVCADGYDLASGSLTRSVIFVIPNPTPGTGVVTVAFDGTVDYIRGAAVVVSGASESVHAINNRRITTVTAAPSIDVETVTADCLVLAAFTARSTTADPFAPAGSEVELYEFTDLANRGGAGYSLDAAAVGTQTPTLTASATSQWAIAAIALRPTVTAISGSTVSAVYDGRQKGSLAALTVSRAQATMSDSGSPVAAGAPRFSGFPVTTYAYSPLQPVRSAGTFAWKMHAAGVDRDGITPIFVVQTLSGPTTSDKGVYVYNRVPDDRNQKYIAHFKLTERTDHASNTTDVLVGEPDEEADTGYAPYSVVVLPGCILFLCVKNDWSGSAWEAVGIGLVALQHKDDDTWVWSKIADGGADFLTDASRGREWALTSYFPTTPGQDPLLEAFIPMVDYVASADPQDGGQIFLLKANRTDIDSDWTFSGMLAIYEDADTGEITHIHAAPWTERGLVAMFGDSIPQNEVQVFSCDDWDDFDGAGIFTQHEQSYGAGAISTATSTEQTASGQWFSGVPTLSHNQLIVFGDNTPEVVYQVSVNVDYTISYRRLWGWAYAVSGDQSGPDGTGSLWGACSRPEQSGGYLSRQTAQNVTGVLHSRTLYSPDGVSRWGEVARAIAVGDSDQVRTIVGDYIYILSFASPSASTFWFRIPRPTPRGTFHPLCVSPGATNLLELSSGEVISKASGGTNTATLVSGVGERGFGPVYRIVSDGSDTSLLSFAVQASGTVSNGFAVITGWVKRIANSVVSFEVEVHDGTTEAEANISVLDDDWMPFTARVDTTGLAATHTMTLEFVGRSDLAYEADFYLQISGVYVNEEAPYPIPLDTTGPIELVTQPLPTLGAEHTITVEFSVPYHALARGTTQAGKEGTTMPLCTIWGDANEYVEITMDFANDQIVCEVFNSGISAGTLTLTNIVMERGDTGWVSVAFGASTMTAAAVCGGFDETGLSSDSDSFTLATAPTEVRFSNEAQDEVPQLDFIAVRVTTGTAFDLDQITTSAGLSYSSLQGPAVRGRERDRTRFGRFR